jgi:dTDP-4-dehydrorhamnose reductase
MTPKKRIAVTGASGMLGTALLDCLSAEHVLYATSRQIGYCWEGVEWKTFDLLDTDLLTRWLESTRPDALVHCAALVNVDACEQEPERASALHAASTAVIADTLSKWGGHLVYISTDSVFDGSKQGLYDEDDVPAPPNVYARTKLEGELAALRAPGATVLRTNIFGWTRTGRHSFAEWVLKGLVMQTPLTMFTDVQYTPIHVSHLAGLIGQIVSTGTRGLFHATGSTVLSKYDFAVRMGAIFDLSTRCVEAVSVDSSGLAAKRPKNMALSSARLGSALGRSIAGADAGISLMKQQYDCGWLANVKASATPSDYHFWIAE